MLIDWGVWLYQSIGEVIMNFQKKIKGTVVSGIKVHGFRAQNPFDWAYSVDKMVFGFKAKAPFLLSKNWHEFSGKYWVICWFLHEITLKTEFL